DAVVSVVAVLVEPEVDDPDSVALVWAPPLLLTVTPDPTCVLDAVAPEVAVDPEPVVLPVDVEPVLVDPVLVDAISVPAAVELAVCVAPVVPGCDPEVAEPLLPPVEEESLDDDAD